jgi:prepilin-type N-terminal cleavage/methylation domain-containing protein
MTRRGPARQAGFTIVEVLVALSIFLLILMGIMQVFEPSNTAYQSSQRKLNVQQNGRVAMDVMVRQIRMTGYFPENIDTTTANDQLNSVEVATNAALAVAGDLDGSGLTNTFLFCLDSAGLRRVQGPRGAGGSYTCGNGAVLAEGVTNLAFAYYDANNDPVPSPPTAPYQLDGQAVGAAPSFVSTTQRAAVRRVVITLTARESVPNQPPQTYTLTSDVRLRNP